MSLHRSLFRTRQSLQANSPAPQAKNGDQHLLIPSRVCPFTPLKKDVSISGKPGMFSSPEVAASAALPSMQLGWQMTTTPASSGHYWALPARAFERIIHDKQTRVYPIEAAEREPGEHRRRQPKWRVVLPGGLLVPLRRTNEEFQLSK
jgi:hypothetical protein